ncbi:hypothetical protein [Parafrankia sp. EUN1f]|uniref:hypothetical protein n=1 Tax=Parafrankia sp. EUN1f TaxID=102897 RepID=UPI0001C43FAC|nr:hypothetical protein [Parafrankia sp. EUN1f]EFC79208.1 hypothetical protein FrEUN1fDRAFT_7679 [Parafrankia sp. EUN1f]
MNAHGAKPFRVGVLYEVHRAWVDALPPLLVTHGATTAEFDKQPVFPYAYRHSYAQRHADAGVPVDVLRQLLDRGGLDRAGGHHLLGLGGGPRADGPVVTLSASSVMWVSTSASHAVGSTPPGTFPDDLTDQRRPSA